VVLWLALSAASADPDVLVVGNSYVFTNDLDVRLNALLQSDPDVAGGSTTRLAAAGLRFADHVDRAEGSDAAWVEALVAEPSAGWVIFQEQSQIPGFPASNAEVVGSRAASVTLDGYARTMGAQTVFLETWGRRDGDATNPDVYPDFLRMNAALEAGYLAYRDGTSTAERPTWVAPAGRAWKAVYEAEVSAGNDPLATGSPFVNLYVADGSHPSLGGTYLAACVIYVTITGHTCVGKPGPDGLGSEEIDRLQRFGTDAVIGSDDLDFPWRHEDTDSPDTDAPDTEPDLGDTGEDDPGRPCGCQTAAAPAAPIAALLVLLAMRRRRFSS
jgi:MYXO-CTERM domain-containing protein